eukprot:5178917-Prymnesium_polylepis.2
MTPWSWFMLTSTVIPMSSSSSNWALPICPNQPVRQNELWLVEPPLTSTLRSCHPGPSSKTYQKLMKRRLARPGDDCGLKTLMRKRNRLRPVQFRRVGNW